MDRSPILTRTHTAHSPASTQAHGPTHGCMQPSKRAPAIHMRLRATWRLPPQTARARLEVGPARRLGALNRRVSTRVRASMRACLRACACLRICGCESGISVYATRSRRRTIELRLLLTRVSLLLRDQGSRLWRLLVQRICTLRGACFCRGYVTSLLRDRFGALCFGGLKARSIADGPSRARFADRSSRLLCNKFRLACFGEMLRDWFGWPFFDFPWPAERKWRVPVHLALGNNAHGTQCRR